YLELAGGAGTAGIARAVAGRLTTLAGQPLAGETVEVQRVEPGGASTTIATATTAADGSFTAAVTLTEDALIRALHGAAPAVVSPLVAVAVGRAVTLTVVSIAPLAVAGTINPPNVRTVTVEVYLAGTRQVVQSHKVRVVRGAYTVTLPTPAPGNYEVYAHVRATASNAAGATGLVPVTIS
ncbi:MAG TPA: hypothetical protein VG223_05275, partial [Solirubrobacteraceae bacterium]|nr:hypothetical protein [Solirubrobacteraceae bacterium]